MLNREITKYLANKHIAGPELTNALIICRMASRSCWANTISVWTAESSGAGENLKKYKEILKAITDNNFNSYLSMKPSALCFDIKMFEALAEVASVKNIRIHFDSLSPDMAGPYLSFLNNAHMAYKNLGYTLPSRWLRSLEDADRISKYKIPVRIVKGQWGDPANKRIDPKENYLNLVKRLSGKVPLIAIATHDRITAEKAINILDKDNVPFELEQFFSLPFIKARIIPENKFIKKRIYVVYGEPYLPYNLRSANKRPEMLLWLIKDILNIKPHYAFEILDNNNVQKEFYEVVQNKTAD